MKKTIVIVGAGPGMGNHIARRFAAEDFRVVLIARDKERLARDAAAFQAEGIEVFVQMADAADPHTLRAAFAAILEQVGPIDVLVYNAAVLAPGLPSEMSAEEWQRRYQVDVASALLCVQLALPGMLAQKAGTVLFTGGGFALHPVAEYASVSVNKAALRALAMALNQELKTKNIFVGTVTIMGNVEAGTHFSPERIADVFWQLHDTREGCEWIYE